MGLIDRAVDEVGADQACGLRREFGRDQDTPAELFAARIGKRQVRLDGGLAVPHREHAKTVRQILDNDLGAQLVEVKLLHEIASQRPRAIEEEAAAVLRWRLGDDEIGDDLALRRQQRAEARRPGLEVENVGGNKPVQKAPGAVTGDFDHATVGEQGSLHGKNFPNITSKSRTLADYSQGLDTQ